MYMPLICWGGGREGGGPEQLGPDPNALNAPLMCVGHPKGRQQNPEHGTFRNISEHSGTSRNRANYHKINEKKKRKKDFKRERLKKQPKNKRTNKQTKFKIRCNSSTFPPILSCDFYCVSFLPYSWPPQV